MIAFGAITFSGCATKLKVIHKALVIPKNCEFVKFTEAEKETITDQVGKKIYLNQHSCILRQQRINAIISAHNEAHQ